MGGEEKGNMHSNFHVAASSNASKFNVTHFFLFWKWFVHKKCWMASTDIHLLCFNISPFSQWNYHLTLVHDQDTIRSRMFKLKCWGAFLNFIAIYFIQCFLLVNISLFTWICFRIYFKKICVQVLQVVHKWTFILVEHIRKVCQTDFFVM